MDLRDRLKTIIPTEIWEILMRVKETAVSLNMPIYLIGGPVRDILLNTSPADLDIIIEGDGIEVAQKMAEQYGGELLIHQPFKTAVWQIESLAGFDDLNQLTSGIQTFDFVTTRKESYARPAALPTVTPSHLLDDLKRRDFPINAMGIRLDGDNWGQLIDPLGGLQDMNSGVIQILHDQSFVDDPTRILRAIRYAARLQFEIEPHTLNLLKEAVPIIDQTTGMRLWHEFEWIFQEAEPEKGMELLQSLGVLEQIVPGLNWVQETGVLFQKSREQSTSIFSYFAIWMLSQDESVETAVYQRFSIPLKTQQKIRRLRRSGRNLNSLSEDAMPSQIVPHLRRLTGDGLMILRLFLQNHSRRRWISQYQAEWQFIKPTINGDDLIALGLKPSAHFKKILNALNSAWLDGTIEDESSEYIFLKEMIEKQRDGY